MLVEQQIQARHVNALGQGICQIDVHLNVGVYFSRLFAVFDFERLVNIAHANPIECRLSF